MAQDWFSQFEQKPKKDDWFDQFDEESTTEPVITANAESEDSILKKAYDVLFNAPKFITEPVAELSEAITEPSLNESPLMAMSKGFIGGSIEGAADLLSPANVLTLGSGS